MSARTAVRRAAALGVATAAVAVTAIAGPSAAAAEPVDGPTAQSCAIGMIPLTNQNTWLRFQPGFTDVLYTIEAGRAFRISAGPAVADGLVWWFGHGNDTGNGWAPEQNLTCA